MPASIRPLTPTPSPRARGGTFEGLEKLFFDKAAAIEAGELTAPPEVRGSSAHPWWAQWRAWPLYQKLGFAGAAVFLLLVALLMFGPHKQSQDVEPQFALPAPAGSTVTAAVVAEAPARPTLVPRKPMAAKPMPHREASAVKPTPTKARNSRLRERSRSKSTEVKSKRHRASPRRLRPLDPFD